MKHFTILITALTILFFAPSCKKQSADPAPVATAKKLQHIATSGSAGATNQSFTYDAQGRLIKEEDEDGTKTFQFGNNAVLIKDFNKLENRLAAVITGTTDNAGRITSYTGISFGSNNSQTSITGQFTYDANGYITQYKKISANEVYSYDFVVTDGDYTSLTVHLNGMGGYTRTTGFTDKKALSVVDRNIPGSFYYNNGLFGKSNTHLAKEEQYLASGALIPFLKSSFSYTMDSDGYVQTIIQSGSGSLFTTYTFQ